MIITKDLLLKVDPQAAKSTLDLNAIAFCLNYAFDNVQNDFNNAKRKACFLGQLCVESAHFCAVKENLNYSAEGLKKTFPKYFTNTDPTLYARNPEKIANHVYANRMGNGDEASGDGWHFRGRGLIQLTGKNNYVKCGVLLGHDLVADPDYLTTTKGCVDSAIWFYVTEHHLNQYGDNLDVVTITKVINGGNTALDERIKFTNSALAALS
jgi:putative chitinase